jgi:signal transduction histidine kinase
MIDAPSQILKRGIDFVRSNPQIVYTLVLVIAIPLGFFISSNYFLGIARENQDRLERQRIGFFQEPFALLAGEHITEPEYLDHRLEELAKNNETMTHFQVLGSGSEETGYPIIASLERNESGTFLSLDPITSFILSQAAGDRHKPYTAQLFVGGERYWRTVHAITATSGDHVVGYILTDVVASQADAVASRGITKAYLVLGGIILLIIGLLARQARIIDYASLYARLKQVDQMKDDFVSMAAHELRSPLTIIRGYVEMLGEGSGMSDASKVHLQHIDRAALQLNSLIGDILDVAKLQEGRMSFNFTALDVSTEIAQVVDSFMRPAEDKGLALLYTPAPLPSISVDTDRFRQLMINLVGNAIKYTPAGEVRVTTVVDAEHVTIRVSDTGMGISAEDQQKLFQKFFRVKSRETEKITGTGLGLWITTQIVKAMKGTISVESIKGKGTDFIVTFPIAK